MRARTFSRALVIALAWAGCLDVSSPAAGSAADASAATVPAVAPSPAGATAAAPSPGATPSAAVAPSPAVLPPVAAGGPPDAETIFRNTRAAWAQGAYPRYATYATVVEFHLNGHLVRRTWDTTEDVRHALVYSRKFAREELANPHVPHGSNVSLLFVNLNPEHPADPIGHVAFGIDQDYGISGSDRHIASVSATALDSARSTLPVIGRTGTSTRDYDVRLIETIAHADGPEYHLGLTPLHDPGRYRLRELFVDGTTWLPQEAVVAGIGSFAPLNTVPWRVEFRRIAGATYIAQETALADLDYHKNGVLRWATVRFEEFEAKSRVSTVLLSPSAGNPQSDP